MPRVSSRRKTARGEEDEEELEKTQTQTSETEQDGGATGRRRRSGRAAKAAAAEDDEHEEEEERVDEEGEEGEDEEDGFGDEDEDGFGDEDEDEEDYDEEEEELPELMVHTRQRRATAGNRMPHIMAARNRPQSDDYVLDLDAEEEEPDEFWDTMKDYFAENPDDSEFHSSDTSSEFDEVDSDFDLPEDLEGEIEELDQEAAEEERELVRQERKAAHAATHALLGQKRTKRGASSVDADEEEEEALPAAKPTKRVKQAAGVGATSAAAVQLPAQQATTDSTGTSAATSTGALPAAPRRASSRAIVREQAEATHKFLEEQARLRSKQRKRQVAPIRILTQEEQLAEAERTEILNRKSLEDLLRVEEQAKRLVARKPTPLVPSVLTISWNKNARLPSRMPGKMAANASQRPQPTGPLTSGSEVRALSYVYASTEEAQKIYSSETEPEAEVVSNLAFRMTIPFSYVAPLAAPTYPIPYSGAKGAKQVCVITGKPAKYRCPYTKLPYSSITALKELRRRVTAGILDPNVVVPEAAEATPQPPHPHLNGLQPDGSPMFLGIQDSITSSVLTSVGFPPGKSASLTSHDIAPDPNCPVKELTPQEERVLAEYQAQAAQLVAALQLSPAVPAARIPCLVPVYATVDTIGPTEETRAVCAQLVERAAAAGANHMNTMDGSQAAGPTRADIKAARRGRGRPKGSAPMTDEAYAADLAASDAVAMKATDEGTADKSRRASSTVRAKSAATASPVIEEEIDAMEEPSAASTGRGARGASLKSARGGRKSSSTK